jgi:hypothetical protein
VTKRNYSVKITILAGLVAGLAGISSALKAIEGSQPEDVSELLFDAKTQSYVISVHAAELEGFMRNPHLTWRTHAAELTRMKEDINAAGKTAAKLSEARSNAEPWQRLAIVRIIPYLKEIAYNTSGAVDYINKNQSKPMTVGDYRDYIEANANISRELASLIADCVDYGNTGSRYESLRQKLELPTKK